VPPYPSRSCRALRRRPHVRIVSGAPFAYKTAGRDAHSGMALGCHLGACLLAGLNLITSGLAIVMVADAASNMVRVVERGLG
jgi:hypothetical protein